MPLGIGASVKGSVADPAIKAALDRKPGTDVYVCN